MIRAFVLYEGEVDPERYQRHIDEFVRRFRPRSGRARSSGRRPAWARYRHHAEFEFPDMASFQEVAGSPEFAAAGKDAAGMGIPFTVHFAEL